MMSNGLQWGYFIMFSLKEFEGTLVTEPYSVNSFDELKRQILKEIVFCGSGLGWRRQCSNEVEQQCILFPYVEKGSDTSEEYIKNLKFLVGSEMCYYRNCVTGTFNAIKDFSWSLDITDNEEVFALILRKM